MLPEENRLKKDRDFEKVFKEGKGFKEDFLFLKIKKNNLKISRFGFVVSQKISKKAIIRNKIKRRLSELVKFKLKEVKKGIDVLIIAIPGLETKDFWETEKTLNGLFRKSEIIKNKI